MQFPLKWWREQRCRKDEATGIIGTEPIENTGNPLYFFDPGQIVVLEQQAI
ncbi:hypothetical protein [Hydrogenophaga sp.]|jgi:hypothetical protein|uniref:hypothetical protein n=1 Tax=Hydrogenophaga sp. TaxID=1904254 RepID=UPI00260D3F98|nr:hypothetical protein [Hydrogenophaga sp.]